LSYAWKKQRSLFLGHGYVAPNASWPDPGGAGVAAKGDRKQELTQKKSPGSSDSDALRDGSCGGSKMSHQTSTLDEFNDETSSVGQARSSRDTKKEIKTVIQILGRRTKTTLY